MGLKPRPSGRTRLPALDAPCGRHLTFRDLIECGETCRLAMESGAPIDNTPLVRDTYDSLEQLCLAVLDPVIDRFGRISITYGFAGPQLAQAVRRRIGRICPPLDQHAGSERNARGSLVCERVGAAADFHVPGVSSRDLAAWLAINTQFDRLYFYGNDSPVHISVSPGPVGRLVLVRREGNRVIPQLISIRDLLSSH